MGTDDTAAELRQLQDENRRLREQIEGLTTSSHRQCADGNAMSVEFVDGGRMLSTLLANLPGMAYRCLNRQSWTMTFVSRGCVRLCGYQPEDLLGDARVSWGNLILEADRAAVWQGVQRGLAQRRMFELHYRIRDAEGRTRWVSEQGCGVYDADGQVEAVEGYISDATEREEARRALRASESQIRSIVQSSPVAIYSLDPQGRVLTWNPAAERLFGWSEAEIIGLPLPVVPPEREPEFRTMLANVVAGTAVSSTELSRCRRDGEAIQIRLSSAPIVDADGNAIGLMSVAEDITASKEAERQRTQLERRIQQTQKLESLGVLAGGIAHDFNNLLMGILGHADLSLEQLPPMSPARESIQQIVQASRRAADLCRQMLAYSGRGTYVIEPVDLTGLVEEMVHLLRASISKKALMNLNLEANLPSVRGDATQIRQVVMNLVINASEAIGERSGVITVSTGAMECSHDYLRASYLDDDLQEGLYVYIEVSDTGCGMDKSTQQRIFEPFFTTKFTGRGLGMAAVLGIVRGHRGALKVYSEVGRGTTFRILFPACPEASPLAAVEPREAAARGDGRGRILLVDDEETVRTLGKRMLEHLGYEVQTAADGQEALKAWADGSGFDLVLLDLTMPHMDGEETFRALRRTSPGVRVVLSSGYTQLDITSRFAGKGLAGFIQKPYTLDQLRQCIRQAIGALQPES